MAWGVLFIVAFFFDMSFDIEGIAQHVGNRNNNAPRNETSQDNKADARSATEI